MLGRWRKRKKNAVGERERERKKWEGDFGFNAKVSALTLLGRVVKCVHADAGLWRLHA